MRACSVTDCERVHYGRGFCKLHYDRVKKHGDPHVIAISSGRFKPGRRGPVKTCSIDGCDAQHEAHGYCKAHYWRFYRWGDPLADRSLVRERHPMWTGEGATYDAVHQRLRSQRGRAAEHTCSHCAAQALQWAYDNNDPDERTDTKSGLRYSIDLDHYIPLCASCHRLFDNERARGELCGA